MSGSSHAARGALLLGAALGLIVGGSAAVLASSGEPFDTAGIFAVDNTTCQDLRTATSVDYGALLFACDADRSTANGRQPCDIFTLSTQQTAQAIGICTDLLPNVSVVDFPPSGPLTTLEPQRQLNATSFGVNTGMTLQGASAGTSSDTVCTSFAPGATTTGPTAAPGFRACRTVVKCGEGGCPATPPAPCDDDPSATTTEMLTTLPSTSSTVDVAALCSDIEARIAASGSGSSATTLSHALFLSATQEVGTPGSQALLVCPGYTWQCKYPSQADNPDGSALDYQIDFGVIETPGCGYRRGRYMCW